MNEAKITDFLLQDKVTIHADPDTMVRAIITRIKGHIDEAMLHSPEVTPQMIIDRLIEHYDNTDYFSDVDIVLTSMIDDLNQIKDDMHEKLMAIVRSIANS